MRKHALNGCGGVSQPSELELSPRSKLQQRKPEASETQRLARRCLSGAVAGAPGFEPGNGGTKIRCLTAWLRPNAGVIYFACRACARGRALVSAAGGSGRARRKALVRIARGNSRAYHRRRAPLLARGVIDVAGVWGAVEGCHRRRAPLLARDVGGRRAAATGCCASFG